MQPARHVFEVSSPDQLLIQAALCDDHNALIAGGAPWDYNWDDNKILMGSDVLPRLVHARVERAPGRTELGDSLVIELELSRDGEIVDLIRLRAPRTLANHLADALNRGRPPQNPGSAPASR